MKIRLWALAGLLMGALGASPCRAHFLFARIGPMAEGGRSAEVYFSDRAEAGDPKFVDKIAHTKLWVQTTPGAFRPLKVQKGVDRLRALAPSSGSIVVAGECEYGVLARPNQTPFLLRYYPKTVAGAPDVLNKATPRAESPLEITAKFEASRVRLIALKDGKPMPGAAFFIVDDNLTEDKATAGPDGSVMWTPSDNGHYCVYFRNDAKRSGEAGGKSYEEIREFATLTFDWPLERTDADSEAVSLFQQALAARAQWKDFPGFSAHIDGTFEDRPFEGTINVSAQGTITSQKIDPLAAPWVESQLSSIVMHRRVQTHEDAEPVLRFADEREDHPLGRLLIFDGGQFASSYRVKDQAISVVNRHMGNSNVTITTLDSDRNPEGRLLPRSYVVQYWDAETGESRKSETIQDRWVRLGLFDLPESHTVTTASGAGFSARNFTLSKHELAPTTRASAP
jgi:Protein of unknown function (DUF3386)